ncbi:MAG: hypothetical protein RBT81_01655 [Gammaproteobacteria bacterium]|jgi:hypothetical protein|nr:hypothetical protein [Gammaproteobacteria bacterium]
MLELLDDPIFQSAIAPFLIALAVGLVLRTGAGLAGGVAFALAVLAAVWMIMGLQFTPLNSTRKLILAGAGAFVLGMVLESIWRHRDGRWLQAMLGLGAAAAALWLVWPRLGRLEGMEAGLTAVLAAAYAGLLVPLMNGLQRSPLAQSAAALALGVGTAISAVIGASALLGQLGGAIAAAAGAIAVLLVIRGEFRLGSGFALPMSLLAALIGISAVVYARLPWFALVPLPLIPLMARVPVPASLGRIPRGLLLLAATMLPAAATIATAWSTNGAAGY